MPYLGGAIGALLLEGLATEVKETKGAIGLGDTTATGTREAMAGCPKDGVWETIGGVAMTSISSLPPGATEEFLGTASLGWDDGAMEGPSTDGPGQGHFVIALFDYPFGGQPSSKWPPKIDQSRASYL